MYKRQGNLVYLVGDFAPTLGGSHWALVTDLVTGEAPPALTARTPAVYRALHRAIAAGLVRACHDLSQGGLAVAAAEMCIAGRVGLTVEVRGDPLTLDQLLYGETNGCLLVEVTPDNAAAFEQAFAGMPVRRLGAVDAEPMLTILHDGAPALTCPVAALVAAWNTPLQ